MKKLLLLGLLGLLGLPLASSSLTAIRGGVGAATDTSSPQSSTGARSTQFNNRSAETSYNGGSFQRKGATLRISDELLHEFTLRDVILPLIDPETIEDIELNSTELPSSTTINALAKYFPHLRSLTLNSESGELPEGFPQNLSALPSLERLTISSLLNLPGIEMVQDSFSKLPKALQNLKEFNPSRHDGDNTLADFFLSKGIAYNGLLAERRNSNNP
jgi:hypothetical protein